MNLNFPPFEPDKASYNTNATDVSVNVVPIADGWGPMASLTPQSSALSSAPRGSITARTAAGVQIAIVGTETALYKVNNDGTLTDISTGTYAVPDFDEWSFDLYGARIIATNLNDGPQYYDVGVSTVFAPLPGSPPAARFVKVIGDFVALFYHPTDPSAIQWSGINNSEQWIPGEELSDINSFPDGEELMAVSINGAGAVLAFRGGFRTMTYSPDSGFVFTFSPFMEGNGCTAPLSLVEIGKGDFVYYSDTGFYRGLSGTPIGAERVDRWIQTVAADGTLERLKGVADPFRKIVLWRYVDAGGNGYIVGYSWQLDRWFQSDTLVTGLGIFATSGYTLEDLDAVSSSLDALPFSLDSAAWGGSRPSFAGFDASFRFGFFAGLPQRAVVETGCVELSPGSRTFVDPVRLISDAPLNGYTINCAYLDSHADTPNWGSEQTPNPRSFVANVRTDGLLHKFRATITAGTDWSTLSAVDAVGVGSGQL
jgi:hypothetical protein